MKIAKGIRDAYNQTLVDYRRLSEEVCPRLQNKIKSNGWFFIHRLKELESFALKVETGRVGDPLRMEDFFAATIIVPTMSQLSEAESILGEMYEVVERRPSQDKTTHKRPSDFVFDDLRLYLRRGALDTGRNVDLDGLIFELQIKTILQYAWGIASHDLIYKTDNVSWSKERIAFQVKAMLEHAEIAIAEAESLAASLSIAKNDRDTTRTLEIIQIIRAFWSVDRLPRDIKRLAESMRGVLQTCGVEPDRLEAILQAEKVRVRLLPTNLSPYAFMVQALANTDKLDFKGKITSSNNRVKIFVHSDMELPDWMSEAHRKIIRL